MRIFYYYCLFLGKSAIIAMALSCSSVCVCLCACVCVCNNRSHRSNLGENKNLINDVYRFRHLQSAFDIASVVLRYIDQLVQVFTHLNITPTSPPPPSEFTFRRTKNINIHRIQ